MAGDVRVPTSPPSAKEEPQGWSVETVLDHVLALDTSHHLIVEEKIAHVMTLIGGNDKRYEQRFDASQKALELGLSTAREAVNTAFTAQEKAINAALAAASAAVLKAENATEKRFESVNEFRGTLDNQQRTLIPRSEVDVMIHGLNDKIAQLVKTCDAQQVILSNMAAERAGIKGGWGYAIGAVGFVLSIGALIAMLSNFSRAAAPAAVPQVIYTPAPAGAMLPTAPPTAVPR